MFMKSLKINNFRKFGTNNNTIEFVEASSYREESDEEEINLAPTTTLIVGKNNSGKTTITKALSKLINSKNFSANDFNFTYLDNLLGKYKELNNEGKLEKNAVLPVLEFKIIIGLEDETNNLVTNLASFMDIGNTNKSEVEIIVKYEIADRDVFIKNVKELLNKEMPEERDKFKKFLELIDGSSFKLNYYDTNGSLKEKFNLKDLIEIKTIKANKIESSKALSKSFSTIIKYRYIMDENKKNDLEDDIMDINKRVTSEITNTHTKNINKALGKIESNDKLEVQLSSDLTFKKLMNNLIRYEYIEQDHHIPEGQFGLGYTNLMAIIADIIDYIEKYPDKAFNSNINMISIEEPETFMHPQMQQLFIKHINDAVNYLLKRTGKNVNSQLVITTHSSNILNSKIHTGNTFNNITYVTIDNSYSDVVNLKDSKVEPNTETRENDLNFLKKHIKYKVSELFFSDSIIFVEGITEETLLNYYIDNDPELNKFYISIFNIDGAHGLVYHKLIKLLKVPTIIITDIDIKREDNEKEHFRQIQNISNRVTTNRTIIKYNNEGEKLYNISSYIEEYNMRIAFQGESINGYYSTSFEESYILTNYKNEILNKVIKSLKPRIYKNIVGEQENWGNVKKNSYKLQEKLSNCKSDFANELLYEFIANDGKYKIPELPKYISDSLEWLKRQL